jgi:hypothetical protein
MLSYAFTWDELKIKEKNEYKRNATNRETDAKYTCCCVVIGLACAIVYADIQTIDATIIHNLACICRMKTEDTPLGIG